MTDFKVVEEFHALFDVRIVSGNASNEIITGLFTQGKQDYSSFMISRSFNLFRSLAFRNVMDL